MTIETNAPSATHHIKRVVAALVVVGAAAIAARMFAYPATFGELGHFRAAAIPQLEGAPEPLHQGRSKCAECHDDVLALHSKDVHATVECETCHGPGAAHVRAQEAGEAAAGTLVVPRTQAACLTCHRRLLARPAAFPQIERAEHYAMLGVGDAEAPCSGCHSPHEPLFVDGKVAEARLHPVISDCASCHKEARDEKMERPAEHPLVFQCSYCHPATSADFAGRAHAKQRCGVCHQYFPISDRGGRILKHRDPRFCLLCHTERPFKKGGAPGIEWPQHRTDMAAADDTRVCADCHREAYHLAPGALAPGNRGGQR